MVAPILYSFQIMLVCRKAPPLQGALWGGTLPFSSNGDFRETVL